MITIFAVPKPFHGHIATIQRNAINSWKQLHSRCQIILLGDEEGTAAAAQEAGALHLPEIARNEYGTPLLNDVFAQAAQWSKYNLLCYVNCDIILMRDFIRAIKRTSRQKNRFLMVGQCWNVEVTAPLAFHDPIWKTSLLQSLERTGVKRGPSAVDYFAFPAGLYQGLPPFALGRACFDLWMIWQARQLGAAVVDVTQVTWVVHQNHDYAHVPGGKQWSYGGVEATRNWELAGGEEHLYNMAQATHRLTKKDLKPNLAGRFLSKSAYNKLLNRWWWLLTLTKPIRHRLGLRQATLKRFGA